MFHIADVKKFRFCPRFFWLHNNGQPLPRIQFVRMEEKMTELAKEKLKIDSFFMGTRGDGNEVFQQGFLTEDWGINVRMEAKHLRIKVPLMHKTDDGYDIYFTYLGGKPRGDDVRYYSDQIWVMMELGILVRDIYVIHLNPEYVRDDLLDIDQCLSVATHFYTNKGLPSHLITDQVFEHVQGLSSTLEEMVSVHQDTIPEAVKLPRCYRRQKCGYYHQCFPDEQSEDPDSIWTLVNSANKSQMVKNGILKLDQIEGDMIEGDRVQYAQIMAAKNQGLFFDRLALTNWLSKVVTPVSFLDFEWVLYATPPYPGMRPMEVLPFQYSLHMLTDEGLKHKQFLGVGDCRLDFIENLLRDIPEEGTVFAYNADGAEKLRLLELARQFPQHKDRLHSLADRLIDLAQPLFMGLYYDVRLGGAFTLKKVIEVINPQFAYGNLMIQHGLSAVELWRKADISDTLSEQLREDLFAYCKRDTEAMVELFQYLRKLVK